MNKKALDSFAYGIIAAAAIGIMVMVLLAAAAEKNIPSVTGKQAIETVKEKAAEAVPQMETPSAKKNMAEGMHKCTMDCVKTCQTNTEHLINAMALLDETSKAMDADDMAAAKTSLDKAKTLLMTIQQSTSRCMRQMPCANKRCPITGKTIDVMNEPENLTCMYKGMKIGFCCPACPPVWDRLTDAEKDAKLQKVMSAMPETQTAPQSY